MSNKIDKIVLQKQFINSMTKGAFLSNLGKSIKPYALC